MSTGIISVLSRKEAFVKGVVLERPEKHQILQIIEERTTIKNAKNSGLIEFSELAEQLSEKFSETAVRKTLIELKLDKLVLMVPGLIFREGSREIQPHIYLIAKPEKKPYDVIEVYHEVVNSSIATVISYVNQGYTFNRDEFWKDLESSMLESPESEIYYPNIYFSIDILFEYPGLEFKAEKNIFDQFKNDLMKGIVEGRKAVWLSNHRVFLLSENHVEELAQTLKSFFFTRILSQYENIPVVSRECDVIKLQEEIYLLDAENKKTMSYIVARTFAVDRYLSTEKYSGQSVYPGKIVLVLIQELEKFIDEAYEKKYIAMIYKKFEELKSLICNQDPNLSPLIFFTDEELNKIPSESVDKLKNERNIIYTTWETSDGTIHLFMEINPDKFNYALESLMEIPEKYFWKILAFRKLLQDSKKITPDKNPFQNKSFFQMYGELLNNAYIRILPFYYHILLFFEVSFIRNMVYRSIKNYIDVQQGDLKKRNQLRRDARKKEFIVKLGEMKAGLNKLVLRNRVLEELDFFYFKQNLIPNIREIKERFPDIKNQTFVNILEDYKFTLVKGDPSEHWDQSLLFYPKNNTWSYNIEKTKQKIKEMRNLQENLEKSNSNDRVISKRINDLHLGLHLN
jgi:hypothetical protein